MSVYSKISIIQINQVQQHHDIDILQIKIKNTEMRAIIKFSEMNILCQDTQTHRIGFRLRLAYRRRKKLTVGDFSIRRSVLKIQLSFIAFFFLCISIKTLK